MLCRHCRRQRATRPRRLCRECYRCLEIRLVYPSLSIFGRRGVGLGNRSQLPPFPTSAQPGSPEKIAVLQERARQEYQLFHPLDVAECESLTQGKRIKLSHGAAIN